MNQRILGEGAGLAYAAYPGGPVHIYQPGQPLPGQSLRPILYNGQRGQGGQQAAGLQQQATYGMIRQRNVPEMVLQSDFRKVSGISSGQ